jgi:hypothetical protein
MMYDRNPSSVSAVGVSAGIDESSSSRGVYYAPEAYLPALHTTET